MDPEVTEDRTEERGGQEHHHHHAPECSAGLHTGGGEERENILDCCLKWYYAVGNTTGTANTLSKLMF